MLTLAESDACSCHHRPSWSHPPLPAAATPQRWTPPLWMTHLKIEMRQGEGMNLEGARVEEGFGRGGLWGHWWAVS